MKNKTEVFALRDVCDLIGGGTPSKSNKSYYNGTIPWATVRDMSGDVITETEHHITIRAVEESSTNILPGGSVVIATRVGLGKVCMLERDTAINQDLKGVIPKRESEVDSRYLFWWLKSVADKIVAAGRGATVQGVKLDFVRSLQIPVPPLPEQRRIVALLDEAFSAIDQAIENTKKNMENAKELFDSYLNEVFRKKGEGWVEKTLIGIGCDVRTGPFGSVLHKHEYVADGVPIVNPVNLVNGRLIDDRAKTVTREKAAELIVYQLHQGDVVVARRGEIGRSGVVTADQSTWLCGTGCFLVRQNQNIDPHYLHYVLRSERGRSQLLRESDRATMPSISKSSLEKLLIPLPDAEGQRRTVEALNDASGVVDRLIFIYAKRIDYLGKLRQSILRSILVVHDIIEEST